MPVDRSVVAEAEVFEEDGGEDEVFAALLYLAGEFTRGWSGDFFEEVRSFIVEPGIGRVGGDFIEVAGDGADVFVDRPFVVVEDDDEALRGAGHVVESFKGRTAGECGVAGNGDDMLIPTLLVAACGETEGGGKGGSRVAGTVAIVLGFGAEKEAIEAVLRADGLDLVPPAGEHFVDVALVGDVEEELVFRRIKDPVEGDGELYDPEVRAEVSAGLRETVDEFFPDFLCEERKLLFGKIFDVLGRTDFGELGVRGHFRNL